MYANLANQMPPPTIGKPMTARKNPEGGPLSGWLKLEKKLAMPMIESRPPIAISAIASVWRPLRRWSAFGSSLMAILSASVLQHGPGGGAAARDAVRDTHAPVRGAGQGHVRRQ